MSGFELNGDMANEFNDSFNNEAEEMFYQPREIKHRELVQCRMCKTVTPIDMPRDAFRSWQNGMLIQKALPMLSDDERELLISQTCPECWKKIFTEVE